MIKINSAAASEVEEVTPGTAAKGDDGMMSVMEVPLIKYFIGVIQETEDRLMDLELNTQQHKINYSEDC